MAKYFEKVKAIDPDGQMLWEGARKASNLMTNNIEWQKGSSKSLNKLQGPYRVVTMGQSFHWMDAEPTLNILYDLIQNGGGIVIIGTVPVTQSELSAQKDKVIKDLVKKYLGPQRRAGKYIYQQTGEKWESTLLLKSKFKNFTNKYYEIKIERSIDEVIGNLFSMSWLLKNY
jgi:ubiquinone/menaquinone biosynthesis C-methylase UbiE